MARVRPEDIVRQFRENGLKLLLQEPGNARDLLALRDAERAARCDFDRMTVDPTTYVAPDYRHVTSDLVLKVPYRTRIGGRRRTLTLYILIEHQSEPDALILLRVLDYFVQICKAQVRAAGGRHGPPDDFLLQPVLPLVLYTGEREWRGLGTLVDLFEGGAEFAELLPPFRPLFLNLATIPPSELETAGGYLGRALTLVQRRNAPQAEFHALVGRAVTHLEGLATTERDRWLLLLSYIQALVYHDRPRAEREELRREIVRSVRTDPRRRELETMTQTIAEALREEGMQIGEVRARQTTLVRLLRKRFGRLPRPIEHAIRGTNDMAQLDTWLDAFATAQTFAEVGLPSSTPPA